MQRLEVSGAVRPLYVSLSVKGLIFKHWIRYSCDHNTEGKRGSNIYIRNQLSSKTNSRLTIWIESW